MGFFQSLVVKELMEKTREAVEGAILPLFTFKILEADSTPVHYLAFLLPFP